LGFMVSTFHEHFTGNKVGGPPAQVGDGYFTLRAPEMNDETWRKFAAVMGREEDLVEDERFATPEARRKNARELDSILKERHPDRYQRRGPDPRPAHGLGAAGRAGHERRGRGRPEGRCRRYLNEPTPNVSAPGPRKSAPRPAASGKAHVGAEMARADRLSPG